jgi:hypothetical protein
VTMTIDPDLVDWGNIQTAIDALGKLETPTDLGLTKLIHDIKGLNEELHDLFFDSFPNQEIFYIDNNPAGIPVSLAKMVVEIMKFCATSNIDLVSALNLWMKEGNSVSN